MKIKSFLILLFAFMTATQAQTCTICGVISGPLAPSNPIFKLVFIGLPNSWFLSDSVVTKGAIASKDFNNSWVGTTYLKPLTRGYKVQKPDFYYDSVDFGHTFIRHVFVVIDTQPPSILNVTVTKNLKVGDSGTLSYLVVDNSLRFSSRRVDISYNREPWQLVSNLFNPGYVADTSDSISKRISTRSLRFVPTTYGLCQFKITVGDSDINNHKNVTIAYSDTFRVQPLVGIKIDKKSKLKTQLYFPKIFNIKGQLLGERNKFRGIYLKRGITKLELSY